MLLGFYLFISQFFHCFYNALLIHIAEVVQLLHRAVLYKIIGDAYTSHTRCVAIVGHEFQYGSSHTSLEHAILHGDDAGELGTYLVQHLFVEGLEEAQVIVCYTQPCLLLKTGNGSGGHVSYGTQGEDGHLHTLLQAATFAHLYLFERTLPIYQHTTATWIADGKGTLVGQLGGVHHAAQFVLVHWRCNGEVGDGAQVSQVECTMVSRSVLAHQSCAVETEYHGQFQYGYVVYDVVIGTLHEG